MEKRVSKKGIIIIVVLIILALAVLAYFLFFNKSSVLYLGFSNPDYSPSSIVGAVVGQAGESNPWKDTKLNPFENETS